MPDFVITDAHVRDAADILSVQKAAFETQAALYDDWDIPPMTETLDEFQASIGERVVLKAAAEGRIAGSVRGCERDGTCSIGRLSVHPAFQKRGIGAALMAAIESRFPGAARFELFTGFKSLANIRLYERLGYRIYKREETLVYMEKSGPAAGQ